MSSSVTASIASLSLLLAPGPEPVPRAEPPAVEDREAASPPETDAVEATTQPFVVAGMIEFHVQDDPSRLWIEAWATEHMPQLLAQRGITPPGEPDRPWRVLVDVRGFTLGFSVAVSATRGGVPVGAPATFRSCACTSDDLFLDIESQVQSVLGALEQAAAPPPAPALLPAPPASQATAATPSTPADAGGRASELGALGILGAVLMPLSVIPLAFGAHGIARGTEIEVGEQGSTYERYDTAGRRALLGIGIAGFLIGATLVGIDQGVCRKRPQGCRRVRPSMALGLGPALRF